jgi:hypothetical protein
MSKHEIITQEQAERIGRIQGYHQKCLDTFGDQMAYAFLAGCELNAAKEELPHGQFMKWREQNLPELPHRTATQYMTFSEKLADGAKLATIANLKLLGNGDLPQTEKEKVLKAVHQVADGKTLTQLYRDLGVIRTAAPAGGNRGDKERAPRGTKQDLKREADLRLADWMGTTRALCDEADEDLALADTKTLKEIEELRLSLGRRIAAVLKKRKA